MLRTQPGGRSKDSRTTSTSGSRCTPAGPSATARQPTGHTYGDAATSSSRTSDSGETPNHRASRRSHGASRTWPDGSTSTGIWIAGEPDRLPLNDLEIPGGAAGSVAWLAQAQQAFAAQLDALADTDLDRMLTTFFGEHRSVENLVRGMTLEAYHHSAEIGCLRDIHRGHARSDWWPEDIPSPEG
jgi:hypothetical protein